MQSQSYRPALALWAITIAAASCLSLAAADESPAAEDNRAKLQERAQAAGWFSRDYMLPRLKALPDVRYPGIAAWTEDWERVGEQPRTFDPESFPEEFARAVQKLDVTDPKNWPKDFDVGALTLHNPNYWQATLEIVPGDAMWQQVYMSQLFSGAEYRRGFYVGVITLQGDNVPKPMRGMIATQMLAAHEALDASQPFLEQATALRDEGKHEEALAVLDEMLEVCPTHPMAWWHYAVTLRRKELKAHSQEQSPPPLKFSAAGELESELPTHFTPEIDRAYARARLHDPLNYSAYLGADRKLLQRGYKVKNEVYPVWRRVMENGPKPVDDATLVEFSNACRDAELYELAVITRQTLVGRRGTYDTDDREFVATCLRALAPGEATEEAIASLEDRTEFFKMAK